MAARFCFRPRVFALGPRASLASALPALAARQSPVLLEGAAGEPRRWSLLAFDPLPLRPDSRRGITGLRALHAELARDAGEEVPGPFRGGFVGALAYDLGVDGERPPVVAPEPWGFPHVLGGLYVDFLVREEASGSTWLVLGEEPRDDRPDVRERERSVRAALERAPEEGTIEAGELVRWTPGAAHRARIEQLRAHIAAGDVYQANLAHRFTCAVRGDPVELYLRLLRANPAPYMGFLAWDDEHTRRGALLSSSPELLLDFDGELARTRPIKGTAPRSNDPDEDRARAASLLASEKDRAELAMIVDLERNDLGRVALPGRVWVEGLPTLHSFARVHHTLADVVAEVRPGVDAFDLLAALFPGGSISGCPKLAAMDLIARLEGEGRGYFCGSLGFVDLAGRAQFNILIRTLCWRPGEVSFRVGGGITWSSDAAAEERETLDKAAALIEALQAGQRADC